jgi:TctA family transporter
MKENKIWIELLYLIAGIAIGVAIGVRLPDIGPFYTVCSVVCVG